MDFAETTAQHGKILRKDIYQAAVDGTPASYHAVAEKFALVQVKIIGAVAYESVNFSERTHIEQHIDPLSGCHATLFVLGFDAILSAAHSGFGLDFTQPLNFGVIAHGVSPMFVFTN
jgi:hypothetical protein